jgi:malic enzyme
VFDTRVVVAVARAVALAAAEEGVARRQLMVAEGEDLAAPV